MMQGGEKDMCTTAHRSVQHKQTGSQLVKTDRQMYHAVPLSSLSTHVSSIGTSGSALRKATNFTWWPVVYKAK
jgi:hypothetical protein